MGRRPKETFLQRGHANGQHTHVKMLKIANYQRNANQNYNEVLLHVILNGHHQKTTYPGEGVEKTNPPTVLVGI